MAERLEHVMSRLEQITRAGYVVRLRLECEFYDAGIVKQKPDLLTHPIVEQNPLNTRDAHARKEAMRLHYIVREDENIQYVHIMSLYPYIRKYFKFPVGHPVI